MGESEGMKGTHTHLISMIHTITQNSLLLLRIFELLNWAIQEEKYLSSKAKKNAIFPEKDSYISYTT